jgi:hypothetical protein
MRELRPNTRINLMTLNRTLFFIKLKGVGSPARSCQD